MSATTALYPERVFADRILLEQTAGVPVEGSLRAVRGVVREDDHARRRYGVAHAPRGRDPVPVAHLYVHEDHVGQKLLRHGERLVSVAGLADDLYLGLGLEY